MKRWEMKKETIKPGLRIEKMKSTNLSIYGGK